MKKIALIYTALGGMPNMLEKLIGDALNEEIRYTHIVDGGLIRDIVAADGLTPTLIKRTRSLFDAAIASESDLIICTCSSIGDVADAVSAEHPELKILRIDYSMCLTAAAKYSKIAVMATLGTTITPSVNLLKRIAAENGRQIEADTVLCEGAYDAMISGNMEKATELVAQTARKNCLNADCIVLAQASMGAFSDTLTSVVGDTPIFNSPASLAEYLKTV